MKPIVSPVAEGARKVGVVRNRADQLRFAWRLWSVPSLGQASHHHAGIFNNRPWVVELKKK